ncbi:type II toxin-antitoxin system RelE/ParE family toxin [Marinobacter sp. HL-58]|uniref:type II toxin-antitoxin system RelE/ParE family toxin n=1 Tax=Marinobacter sp. HL-58 TaxID=1479237 RepID=UPI0009DF2B8C|nr:type II toxin-antitoxin system RelE/ParE family toxin [Marinobacter sp. HL-58]
MITKAKEGIGRGIFCYMRGKRMIILHVFVKKDQKIPKKDLELANERLKEVKKS